MDIFRMMGIIIIFGVPAIVGGGLVFHVLESWIAVAIWEVLNIVIAASTAYKVAGRSAPGYH
ncbi:MAG: hypothetical protein KAV83_01580 [Desulfobacterales bacterium]|nr:hypothetical protein [Desulfobacterales bacterium]